MSSSGDSRPLKIVTRQSQLALWQAHFVGAQLQQQFPFLQIEYIPVLTEGDRWLEASLVEKGGKGLFVKELELALLEHQADLAVHSLKDMPAVLPENLCLGAVLKRASPWDALLTKKGDSWQDLPANARIGTSSLRRSIQLQVLRPDVEIVPLRGNVPTRIQKLQNLDGIILAEAGLLRLGLEQPPRYIFSADELLPAVGQGVIGVECRSEDARVLSYLSALNDLPTAFCVAAERAVNEALNGGCQMPLAALAVVEAGHLQLEARVGCLQKRAYLSAHVQGSVNEAQSLGKKAAEQLLQQGAGDILDQIRHAKFQ